MQRYLALATVVAMVATSAPASAKFFNKKCCESAYTDCCGASSAPAGNCCGSAPAPAPVVAPAPQYVSKTIMVPETVWETRQVKSWECFPVTKDVPVTVCKTVQVVEPRTCTVTEYQKVAKTRTCNVKVCKPVTVQEQRTCTTYTKETVQKQGFRTVCRKVPVCEYKTVTKDCGHWEHQCVQTGCKTKKTCCGCETVPTYKNKRVWVPNCVTTQVPVHTCRTESVQEPYTYCETICKPCTKTETVNVCKMVESVESRVENYFECVPVTKTVTNNVTVCKQVQVTETRKCTSYERREVVKECKVAVCKMVPKTIQVCETPCNTGCDTCGSHNDCGCSTSCKKSFSGFFGRSYKHSKKSDCGCGCN